MGKEAIKIILADAQYLTRAGLKYLLSGQPQLKVVAEATDRDELAAAIAQEQPHVVIIDHHNTDQFTLADIGWLGTEFPEVNVMLVTDEHSREQIHALLAQGVNCILTKHCGPEEIVSAVLATYKKEKFYCNKVLEIILEKHTAPEEVSCSPSNLSAREAEIIGLIAQGVTTKDIADRLCLSLHTVYTHRKNIMRKLSINSVSEMILYAMHAGIGK
jgi:DNA-binding NarL/FixJ family response regulator